MNNRGKISIVQRADSTLAITIDTNNSGDVWVTRHEIADLFQIFVSAVSSNLKVIFKSNELFEDEVRADQLLEMALTENLLREDITPLEEMIVYNNFIEQKDYSVEQLCSKFGKSESYIRNRMRLNYLIEEH